MCLSQLSWSWGYRFWKEPYRATRISTVAQWEYGSRENQCRATRFSTIAKWEIRFRENHGGPSRVLLYVSISVLNLRQVLPWTIISLSDSRDTSCAIRFFSEPVPKLCDSWDKHMVLPQNKMKSRYICIKTNLCKVQHISLLVFSFVTANTLQYINYFSVFQRGISVFRWQKSILQTHHWPLWPSPWTHSWYFSLLCCALYWLMFICKNF